MMQYFDSILNSSSSNIKWYFCKTNKSWPLKKHSVTHMRFELTTKLQIQDGNSASMNPILSYMCTGVSCNKRALHVWTTIKDEVFYDNISGSPSGNIKWYFCNTDKSWPLKKPQWLIWDSDPRSKLQIHEGNKACMNPIWSYMCTGGSCNKRA